MSASVVCLGQRLLDKETEMAKKKRENLNFVGAIQDGENPNGMTGYTVNGTSKSEATGWNGQDNYQAPQYPASPLRRERGNRSGE